MLISSTNLLTKLLDCFKKSYEKVSLDLKIFKIGEEYGELIRVFLKIQKSKNSTEGLKDKVNNDKELKEMLLEEAIDVYLTTIDTIYHIVKKYGLTDKEVQELLEKKIEKWYQKIKD